MSQRRLLYIRRVNCRHRPCPSIIHTYINAYYTLMRLPLQRILPSQASQRGLGMHRPRDAHPNKAGEVIPFRQKFRHGIGSLKTNPDWIWWSFFLKTNESVRPLTASDPPIILPVGWYFRSLSCIRNCKDQSTIWRSLFGENNHIILRNITKFSFEFAHTFFVSFIQLCFRGT